MVVNAVLKCSFETSGVLPLVNSALPSRLQLEFSTFQRKLVVAFDEHSGEVEMELSFPSKWEVGALEAFVANETAAIDIVQTFGDTDGEEFEVCIGKWIGQLSYLFPSLLYVANVGQTSQIEDETSKTLELSFPREGGIPFSPIVLFATTSSKLFEEDSPLFPYANTVSHSGGKMRASSTRYSEDGGSRPTPPYSVETLPARSALPSRSSAERKAGTSERHAASPLQFSPPSTTYSSEERGRGERRGKRGERRRQRDEVAATLPYMNLKSPFGKSGISRIVQNFASTAPGLLQSPPVSFRMRSVRRQSEKREEEREEGQGSNREHEREVAFAEPDYAGQHGGAFVANSVGMNTQKEERDSAHLDSFAPRHLASSFSPGYSSFEREERQPVNRTETQEKYSENMNDEKSEQPLRWQSQYGGMVGERGKADERQTERNGAEEEDGHTACIRAVDEVVARFDRVFSTTLSSSSKRRREKHGQAEKERGLKSDSAPESYRPSKLSVPPLHDISLSHLSTAQQESLTRYVASVLSSDSVSPRAARTAFISQEEEVEADEQAAFWLGEEKARRLRQQQSSIQKNEFDAELRYDRQVNTTARPYSDVDIKRERLERSLFSAQLRQWEKSLADVDEIRAGQGCGGMPSYCDYLTGSRADLGCAW
uniref:Uncharacterized protein n=1 Tax=Palpitomonas bilix TaxID=652834 RepID=A0A7S3GBC4_9EUKA|mmetsp:Transcript_35521/g.92585  ORF Transcript_35521/g.92585 Transcript_35521/m.92585 type:complete len:656 (+) Transcript_35521:93-2060(+)